MLLDYFDDIFLIYFHFEIKTIKEVCSSKLDLQLSIKC